MCDEDKLKHCPRRTPLGKPRTPESVAGPFFWRALADAQEVITFFNMHGAMIYLDDKGQSNGYEDVFTQIAMCRKHYTEVGLGEAYVDQFVC